MNLLRRRKPPATYPGIRLRISTRDGIVIETDSDELHALAVLGGDPDGGWSDLIAGGSDGTTEFSTVPLKIEVKPITLLAEVECTTPT